MQTDDEKILLRHIEDIEKLATRYNCARFGDFLDEVQTALVEEKFPNAVLYGGGEYSQRKMVGFFPDWQDCDFAEFPISVIRIDKKGDRELTHRDYLGTVMSLGIERKKIGDIVVDGEGCYIYAEADISEHIKDSITKIANCGVRCKIVPTDEVVMLEPKFEILDIVVSALRADAVCGAILKLSRNKATELIASGKVMVNHKEIADKDFGLCESDLLSIRGFGRAQIYEIGNNTRSGKLHVKIKKYI